MLNYTEGPWEADGFLVRAWDQRELANADPICNSDKECRDNAKLMAASPEMYELLVDIRDARDEITNSTLGKLQRILGKIEDNIDREGRTDSGY